MTINKNIMKHPNPKCQRKQEEFLKNCPEEDYNYYIELNNEQHDDK